MKQGFIQELLLYRYRYPLAYLLWLAALLVFLGLQIVTIPPGLSQNEINSVTLSTESGWRLHTPAIDLPYHLLQKASISLLGLTPLAIKLPSLLLALLSGIMLAALLNRWQKSNVAIVTSLLAVSSSLFLIAGRSGTPSIMIIFSLTAVLLLATLIAQRAGGEFLWKILFLPAVALTLYTPLSFYFLLAATLSGLLHPHLRYGLRRFGAAEAVIGGFFGLLIASPLIYSLWLKPAEALNLLGLSDRLPQFQQYLSALADVLGRLGDFTSPSIGEFIRPAFTLAAIGLIVLGVIRCFGDHHAVRSYLLLLWTALLMPFVAMRPELITAFFLPAALFMAIGTDVLIREWYSLFPLNPYARITGLLPLMALVAGMLAVNYSSYFGGMAYGPRLSQVYSQDLTVVRRALASPQLGGRPVTIITDDGERAFYSNLSRRAVTVTAASRPLPDTSKGAYLVSVKAALPAAATDQLGKPAALFVSQQAESALRWRLYIKP